MRSKKLILLHIIFPLILGAFIYVSFRSLSIRLFNWFKLANLDFLISFVRETFYPIKKYLPQWVYFSIPDGLWVYSFSSALIILWSDQFRYGKFWLIIPLLFGAFIELAQKIKIFPGTFDIIDFTFSIIALALSIIILKPKIQTNEKHYL